MREKEECSDKPEQRGFAGRQMKGIVLDKFVGVNLGNEYGKGVNARNLPPSQARTPRSPHFRHSLFEKLSRPGSTLVPPGRAARLMHMGPWTKYDRAEMRAVARRSPRPVSSRSLKPERSLPRVTL